MKENVLKSVHVAFDDEDKASIQLQYAERLVVNGEMIRELYLPHERFSLSGVSSEEKMKVAAALGGVATALGEKAEVLTAELEVERVAHIATQEALAEAHGAIELRDSELEAARAEIERLSVAPEISDESDAC